MTTTRHRRPAGKGQPFDSGGWGIALGLTCRLQSPLATHAVADVGGLRGVNNPEYV